MANLNQVGKSAAGVGIGGQTTLDTISRHDSLRKDYTALAEAAGSMATPQIRNVGTIAGNVCQRPWCWYYRNGFQCFGTAESVFLVRRREPVHDLRRQSHYIVHPSDTAPALVALGATFTVGGLVGAQGACVRLLRPATVELGARKRPRRGRAVASIGCRPPGPAPQGHGPGDLDPRCRRRPSSRDGPDLCRSARIVLGGVAPIPWRLPEVERMLTGQRITEELAAKASEASVTGARALSKNAYKIPLTRGVVRRAILEARR